MEQMEKYDVPTGRSVLALKNISPEVATLVGKWLELKGEVVHGAALNDVASKDRTDLAALRAQISERLVAEGKPALKEGELE